MGKSGFAVALGALFLTASSALAQGPDPRTAAGQLAACGGAAKWRAVGYLEFEVKIVAASGAVQGPYHYHWDRRNGYLRVQGTSGTGGKLDAAIDVASRSGGAWENGAQLSGKKLADAVNWALARFGEDSLWLTFPFDWGAAGVTVSPQPDAPGEGGKAYPAVAVTSSAGTWKVTLDPATGRIARTAFSGKAGASVAASWDDWQAVGGVWFARKHSVADRGETVEVTVNQAQPEAPKGAF